MQSIHKQLKEAQRQKRRIAEKETPFGLTDEQRKLERTLSAPSSWYRGLQKKASALRTTTKPAWYQNRYEVNGYEAKMLEKIHQKARELQALTDQLL